MCLKMKKLMREGRVYDHERLFCQGCCEESEHPHFPQPIMRLLEKKFKEWEAFHKKVEQEYESVGKALNMNLAAIRFFTD